MANTRKVWLALGMTLPLLMGAPLQDVLPQQPNYVEIPQDPLDELPADQVDLVSQYLVEVLEEPWSDDKNPLLYVENYDEPLIAVPDLSGEVLKRSWHHRRYPWKRQNARSKTYDSDTKFLCRPSREDIYRLLVALHEPGHGVVNFCKRRRPAATIFSNIHLVGRRRK